MRDCGWCVFVGAGDVVVCIKYPCLCWCILWICCCGAVFGKRRIMYIMYSFVLRGGDLSSGIDLVNVLVMVV